MCKGGGPGGWGGSGKKGRERSRCALFTLSACPWGRRMRRGPAGPLILCEHMMTGISRAAPLPLCPAATNRGRHTSSSGQSAPQDLSPCPSSCTAPPQVTQGAIRRIANRMFAHLHGMDLAFHLQACPLSSFYVYLEICTTIVALPTQSSADLHRFLPTHLGQPSQLPRILCALQERIELVSAAAPCCVLSRTYPALLLR